MSATTTTSTRPLRRQVRDLADEALFTERLLHDVAEVSEELYEEVRTEFLVLMARLEEARRRLERAGP